MTREFSKAHGWRASHRLDPFASVFPKQGFTKDHFTVEQARDAIGIHS
jgi:hypothetical protein